jgi:hypothetical protein
MASKTAVLAVRVISDTKQGQAGLSDLGKSADSAGSKMEGLALPAAAAAAAIVALGTKAVSAASDVQQATGAVEAVFGAQADAVKRFADQAATSVGLSKAAYSNMAAILGSQLKNAGVPFEQLGSKTNDLIKLGSDLAAVYGGDVSDAVSAVSSLLRGETDPIERYGVSIKQVDINARIAALGLDTSTSAALKNAQATAALSLLYDQTADASGQFAAQTGTLAEQQQIANAQMQNAWASIGESLLPIYTALAAAAAQVAGVIAENSTVFVIFGAVILAVSGYILAYNLIVKAVPALLQLWAAAQWLVNAAMTANPIGLLIAAIVLLIAIIVVVATHWQEFGRIFSDVCNAIVDWWNGVVNAFANGFNQIIGWIQDVLGWFGSLFGAQQQASGGGFALTAGLGVGPLGPDAFPAVPFPLTAASIRFPRVPAPPRSTSRLGGPAQVVNVTVNGALDPNAVGRQIEDLLSRRFRANGTVQAAGGQSWR